MSKKNYYLCVTPFFPSPNDWRGSYVYDQVKAIQRNSDYEVVVFKEGGKNDSDYEIGGIKVYRYRIRALPSNILNGIFNDINAKSFVKRVLSLGIHPKEILFVHCHVSMRSACGVALKRLNPKIKVILQHHDLDPFNLRSGVIGRYNRWNIRYRAQKAMDLYRQVDLHVCISKACRDALLSFPNPREIEVYDAHRHSLSLCKGLDALSPRNTYVLYNGVDSSMFCVKLSNQKNHDVFRIGCVANFIDSKDHITLIKAFEILHKENRTMRLSFLGSGETRKSCEDYLQEHGLMPYVEWNEEVCHNQLPEYYHTLDLFVLPSYYEGLGCVFLEAAACGIPFIGCLNQGYSEYVVEQAKWLIQPHDYKQLATIIKQYVESPTKQHFRFSFDIDVLIRDYLTFINGIGNKD